MKQQPVSDCPSRRLTIVLFIIYILVLSWILIFKLGVQFSYMEKRTVNLIPFNEPSIVTIETISNVVIFIPLGIYSGILFVRWTFSKIMVFIFSVSLIVEGLQYLMRIGAFDITDLITNTAGGLMGLLMLKAIGDVSKNNGKKHKIINIIATSGTIVMILMLALLKMNMLPVRYQ